MRQDTPYNPCLGELSRILLYGDIVTLAQIPWGSNDSFLIELSEGTEKHIAVYKPRSGERPLYDFKSGTLYKREYTSYVISLALSWDFIPCTVIREGPYGVGTVQQFVDFDLDSSYFTLREDRMGDIEKIALFDCVSNNADRKAGHCLKDMQGKVWSIDHGLTFNEEPKLRTVIWDFVDKAKPATEIDQLIDLRRQLDSNDGFVSRLTYLLEPGEIAALKWRLDVLIRERHFPDRDLYRRDVPWPVY